MISIFILTGTIAKRVRYIAGCLDISYHERDDDLYPIISDHLGKFLFCNNRENDFFGNFKTGLDTESPVLGGTIRN
ncbi:MAG: hypothetical protein WC513_01390 [Bacteroidales bacterium]|nr:hypothetical protein [Bacteroidales bacterium]MDD4473559.1 hypothetical protein [Bacteroidales bacterium]MDD5047226.1 hypothetical protein [Bacteroidales bacterium]MDD5517463.1 hypothetical protein [Bacteroidales bacterium]MDY0353998.1 hypothetical protein [Bacteroidales bacterium]